LALPHRLRRKPFEETQNKMERLEQRLEEAPANLANGQEQPMRGDMQALGKKKPSR